MEVKIREPKEFLFKLSIGVSSKATYDVLIYGYLYQIAFQIKN